MNIIWLWITSTLSFASVFSDANMSHIKVFPAWNQSIAGVIQVSYLDDGNQPQYAFNASEARKLCSSLRLTIASKSHVQEALRRGLETCRFGWIDEHFAVIPRIQALTNCGKNQTGLVPWRAAVTAKFDVFCFNKSDAAAQLKDAATDNPLSSSYYSENTQHPFQTTNSTPTTWSLSSSSSSTLTNSSNEVEPARFVMSPHGSSGAKTVIITCTCGLFLITVAVLAYMKLGRRFSPSSDKKQQQEYIQTEERTCGKNINETDKAVQEDHRIQVDDSPQ